MSTHPTFLYGARHPLPYVFSSSGSIGCVFSARGELSQQDILQPDDGRSARLEDVQRDACLGSAEIHAHNGRGTSAESDP